MGGCFSELEEPHSELQTHGSGRSRRDRSRRVVGHQISLGRCVERLGIETCLSWEVGTENIFLYRAEIADYVRRGTAKTVLHHSLSWLSWMRRMKKKHLPIGKAGACQEPGNSHTQEALPVPWRGTKERLSQSYAQISLQGLSTSAVAGCVGSPRLVALVR